MGTTRQLPAADADFDPDESPTRWFAELEIALRANDREREVRARGELARLGVAVWVDDSRVPFPRPRAGRS